MDDTLATLEIMEALKETAENATRIYRQVRLLPIHEPLSDEQIRELIELISIIIEEREATIL